MDLEKFKNGTSHLLFDQANPDAPDSGGSDGGDVPSDTPSDGGDTPADVPSDKPKDNDVPADGGHTPADAPKDTPDADKDTPDADKDTPVKGDWPNDWREKMAGDDKKFLNVLKRYSDPMAFSKAHRELQTSISKGDFVKPLGENPSDEELKAYREANGIPAEPNAYLENLPDGLVIGDDDREEMEAFAKDLHGLNAKPEVAQAAINAYYKAQEKQAQAMMDADNEYQRETVEQLKKDWGGDYDANINVINAYLNKTFGNDLAEDLRSGRLADGRPIMSHPKIAAAFADIGRRSIGDPSVVTSGGNTLKDVETRMKEIESKMGTKEYYNGLDKEYGELIKQKEFFNQANG